MALKIWVRIPWTIEAIAITVVTPMTTPRMVRPERSLLARRESKAIADPFAHVADAEAGRHARLFGAERGDRVEPRGPGGREHAEDDARRRRPAPAPRPTDQRVTRAGSGVKLETAAASPQPASTPCSPPSVDSTIASIRNWRRMSPAWRPSDLRSPISRVRSVTLISMMFMMTMPPTTMPMQTTAGMAVNSTRVSWRQNATSASALSTVKSFSSPGRSRCAIRMASSARAMAPVDRFGARPSSPRPPWSSAGRRTTRRW